MSTPESRNPRSGAPHGLVPRGAVPSQRCVATSSQTGLPCKRWATVGAMVCSTHGASAPQVREAARRRILEFAPEGIRLMMQLAEDDSVPPAARVRALIDLLDRAGLKAPEEHVVVPQEATNADLDARLLAALELRRQAPHPRRLGERSDSGIEDAEVVDQG